jgi:DNA-binding transcriptional LysR family regulator
MQFRGAGMQNLNWQDLRYVLAISRGRTFTAAARLLGVDDTTVARRLAVLQRAIGAHLYQRLPHGSLQLTEAGERAALHAERVEREISHLDARLSGGDNIVAGTVRVTSVPILINHLLVPAASRLLEQHPALKLELISDPRDFSLTRREADLALRLARPRTGGTKLTARRIGRLHYSAYATAACSKREAAALPWITYDEAMAHLPQARWIAEITGDNRGKLAAIAVSDGETILSTVRCGLGRSLLPCIIADADRRLRRLDPPQQAPVITRELWLLAHTEFRNLSRMEAVVEWIEKIVPRR